MRINGFTQTKAFYSWVFDNQDKNIRSTHISLYMFLVNQNNRNNWIEWFKCPFDLAMGGSGISNKKTYYTTLNELQEWKLIEYKKGINNFKAPLIKIEVLFDTSTVPQSEPQLLPQVIPLPAPLLLPQLYKNIKLLTNNIEPITYNIEKIIKFLEIDNFDLKEKEIFNFSNELFSDPQWNEDICRMNKINSNILLKYLNNFDLKLKSELETKINKQEYASHFSRWLKIELKNEKKDQLNQKEKLTGAQAFAKQFE